MPGVKISSFAESCQVGRASRSAADALAGLAGLSAKLRKRVQGPRANHEA